MIVAAVVCPHPPLLLRELCGAEDAVPELRAACGEALGSALGAGPDTVVVVGGADTTASWDPALPTVVGPFGATGVAAPVRAADGLPPSLGVARRLLEEEGWTGPTRMHSIAWDAGGATVRDAAEAVRAVEGAVVLVVLADGGTRRGDTAPGYVDERAFGFDDEIGRCLDEGDAGALTRLDAGLAAELMVAGRAALGVLGEAVAAQGTAPLPRVLYRADPYGVQYTVALWQLPG